MKTTIEQVRETLKESIDEKTRASSSRYFKENEAPKVYGVRMAEVNRIGKYGLQQIKNLSKQHVFELCEELLSAGYLEEAAIACIWAESLHKQYEPADFQVFERWVHNYVTNWAACDTLCNHKIGTFIMMYPDYIAELKKWATSSNLWVKRASSVTLIIPARKGLFLDDIFQIALILLHDNNDLVQKGYGWMLKAASEAHQKEVFDFVVKQKATMPRTALRYAIEKMPADMKAEAMRKDILNI
ncbi:MAG: DNA alkylation repair protein [Proteiniphilum sp.]|nr:DNA alkylation repair protein [Proteiniphilum sp.]